MTNFREAPTHPRGEVRDQFHGYSVRYSGKNTPLVQVNGAATGTQNLSPDEARETAEALRDGGEPLNRIFEDEDVFDLADSLEEAATTVEEKTEEYRQELEEWKQEMKESQED